MRQAPFCEYETFWKRYFLEQMTRVLNHFQSDHKMYFLFWHISLPATPVDLGLQLNPKTCLLVRGALQPQAVSSTWPGSQMLKHKARPALGQHIRMVSDCNQFPCWASFAPLRRVIKLCSDIQMRAFMIKYTAPLILFFLLTLTCWQARKCGSLLDFRPAAAGLRWLGKKVAQQESERRVGFHLWCKEKNPIKPKKTALYIERIITTWWFGVAIDELNECSLQLLSPIFYMNVLHLNSYARSLCYECAHRDAIGLQRWMAHTSPSCV